MTSSITPDEPRSNGDEDRVFGPGIRYIGNFHKTLPHNEFGEVIAADYQAFRTIAKDSNAPDAGDFEKVAPGPLAAPHQAPLGGNPKPQAVDRLVSPLAGRARETSGPDPQTLNMLPAPEVLSDSTAAEMVELYWMAVLRDVSIDLVGTSAKAVDDVGIAFQRALTNDKTEGRLRLGLDLPAHHGKLHLTPETLFRCGTPDEDKGPLVSQFFLHDVQYGTQTIKQHQFPYRAGSDYLTDYASWLLAQNAGFDLDGLPYPNANSYFADKLVFDDPVGNEPVPRQFRIRTMRDLARFVHKDALHQAYFNAALLLQWGAPLNPGNPYSNGTYKRQRGFATLGGPHILTQVSEVASRALKVVWRQKWLVNRRLRPEAYGGLLQMQENGLNGTKRAYGLPAWLCETQAAQLIRNRPAGTLFLPLAFTSGSPVHPAYGAGHACVAGACVTMLKAWFDESQPIKGMVEKAVHPDTLQPLKLLQPKITPDDNLPAYNGVDAGAMTVGGELNKIACNVAMGRSMGGVHWRTDNTRSLRLGEQVATIMLKRQSLDYAETPFRMSYRNFDNAVVEIANGSVTVADDPALQAFYAAH